MEVQIDKQDLKEYAELLDKGELTQFLVSHTASISVVALILQTLIDKRDELEKFFE